MQYALGHKAGRKRVEAGIWGELGGENPAQCINVTFA